MLKKATQNQSINKSIGISKTYFVVLSICFGAVCFMGIVPARSCPNFNFGENYVDGY